jgi:hypothetical protein
MRNLSEDIAIPSAIADLFQKGISKAADFQKFALDLYAIQAADALKTWKSMIPASSSWPGVFFFDTARMSLSTFIEIQKGLVDVLSQTSMAGAFIESEAASASQDNAEDIDDEHATEVASKVADKIAELMSSVPQSAAGQGKILMVAVQQNDALQNKEKPAKRADKRHSSPKKNLHQARQ